MKKFNLYSVFLILFLLIVSCAKENNQPSCEVYKTGTITISNSSSNPYKIYIDGVFQIQLSGGSISQELEINEGNGRELYAVQVSGYLFYPTEKQTTLNVVRCSSYNWQIP
jgi:hypothetical protein